MIVVEGPDSGGKSTLCKRLSEALELPLSPHSLLTPKQRNDPAYRTNEVVRERVWTHVFQMVTGTEIPYIHDRLFFSELVYSDIFEREPAFTWGEQRHILRLMNACEIPIIFCMPPYRELQKHFVADGEMDGVPEKIKEVWDRYLLFLRVMQRKRIKGITNRDQPYDYMYPPAILYNYTKKTDFDKVLHSCKEYIRRRKNRGGGWYEGFAPPVMAWHPNQARQEEVYP